MHYCYHLTECAGKFQNILHLLQYNLPMKEVRMSKALLLHWFNICNRSLAKREVWWESSCQPTATHVTNDNWRLSYDEAASIWTYKRQLILINEVHCSHPTLQLSLELCTVNEYPTMHYFGIPILLLSFNWGCLEIQKYIAICNMSHIFIAIYSSHDRGLNERCPVTSLHSLKGKSGVGALVGLLFHEPPMMFEDWAMMKLFDHRQLIPIQCCNFH